MSRRALIREEIAAYRTRVTGVGLLIPPSPARAKGEEKAFFAKPVSRRSRNYATKPSHVEQVGGFEKTNPREANYAIFNLLARWAIPADENGGPGDTTGVVGGVRIQLSRIWRPTLRTPCGEERLARPLGSIFDDRRKPVQT
jgi:hypothetical protein